MAAQTPIEIRHSGVPRWASILTALFFLVGGVYLASNLAGENPAFAVPGASPPAAARPPGSEQAVALIEEAGCQSCHGADLGGSGAFPSLHNVADGPVSENLAQLAADHPDDWIALWIAGTDPAVADLDRGGMPVFGPDLTPEEIDVIVEYLKSL